MPDHRDTLVLPFEKGLLSTPRPGENYLLLNAQVLPSTGVDWKTVLTCEQGFRSEHNLLELSGYQVAPRILEPANFAGSFVLAGRSKQQNQANITRAWNATKQGGAVVVAGAKTSGLQPLRKWVTAQTEVAGSLSKHHAIVFWMTRNGDQWPLTDLSQSIDGYHIDVGMFSASGPDRGSKVLVELFDDRIRGHVADFGAGWGYLSGEVLKRSNNVERVSLYEADFMSLEAAKKNVPAKADFHWIDMRHEAPRIPFNWIVMNPPFHSGRATEPQLGITFIEAASSSLPAGGRLLMVANTNLPYEAVLKDRFKKVERLVQKNGFKVIEAVR